jgi:hypothetical protein
MEKWLDIGAAVFARTTASQILIPVISFIGSAFGAFLGSWLGLRRFRQERMWEEKFRVYQTLFNAMNDLCERFDQLWDAHVAARQLPPEKEALLQQAAAKAWPEVTKQARIGSFILSDHANATLTVLLKEVERAASAEDYAEYIDHQGSALNKALKVLKDAARADLRAR